MNQFTSLWRRNLGAESFLRNWRTTLAGLLIGFFIGQAMALAWLALSPGKTDRERQLLEAASREAAAHCFKLISQEAKSSC